MDKLTKSEQEKMELVGREVKARFEEESKKLRSSYCDEVVEAFRESEYYSPQMMSTKMGKELYNFLRIEGNKPSDFFAMKMSKMPGWIPDYLVEDFYYSIDCVNKWQASTSWRRRSMRVKEYYFHINHIFMILNEYHKSGIYGTDIVSVFKGNVSDEINAYYYYSSYGIEENWIAAELDRGNIELENILEDIIYGDNNQNEVSYGMIRGIVKSGNKRMHEILGKYLLAARLQEGIRQAICESMDLGTEEAFLTLLNVIKDNNMIRYSAVMRAVGTWTGLLTNDEKDLDRITQKEIDLIAEYLTDENKRKEALKSEDSMKIYLALWSYGFYDLDNAGKIIAEFTENSTKHQRMVGMYYLRTMENESMMHSYSKIVVDKYNNELDTMAVAMDCFMSNYIHHMTEVLLSASEEGTRYFKIESMNKRAYAEIEYFFDKREECEKYYDILTEMLEAIPKKEIEFSPCIFPWNTEKLEKSSIIIKLALCASALHDEEKIEKAASRLSEIDTSKYGRSLPMCLLLAYPVTDGQRRLLTEAVGDKETYTRDKAFVLINRTKLNGENYRQLEEMLRYKKSDIRENVLKLLYQMDDNDMKEMIKRLLTDKKEEKRTAGLDLLLQLKQDENRASLYDTCKELIADMNGVTTKEQILIDSLADNQNDISVEEGYGIYDVNAAYEPELNEKYISECKEKFIKVFPKSILANGGKVETIIGKVKTIIGKEENREIEIIKKLDSLIEENKLLEYETNFGEVKLLGEEGTFHYIKSDESKKLIIPFGELWEEFYKSEIKSYEESLRLKLYFKMMYNGKDEGHRKAAIELCGKEFVEENICGDKMKMAQIIESLIERHENKELLRCLSIAAADYLLNTDIPLFTERILEKNEYHYYNKDIIAMGRFSIFSNSCFDTLLEPLNMNGSHEDFENIFPIVYKLMQKHNKNITPKKEKIYYVESQKMSLDLSASRYIIAYVKGIISKDFMFKALMENDKLSQCVEALSKYMQYYLERNRTITGRKKEYSWGKKS